MTNGLPDDQFLVYKEPGGQMKKQWTTLAANHHKQQLTYRFSIVLVSMP